MNTIPSLLCASSLALLNATAGSPKPVDLNRFSPGARAAYERVDWNSPRGAAHIVGFNYQPSWAKDGVACWLGGFDPAKYRAELANGKKHFPTMNTVRIWLHYGAWMKDKTTVSTNVATAFEICRELDLLVIPCVTSKWGKEPWGTWGAGNVEDPNLLPEMEEYFLAMDAASKGGGNVLVWDVCNEPDYKTEIWDEWLRKMCNLVRGRFSQPKATIGYAPGGMYARLSMLDAVDLWTLHSYNSFMHKANEPEEAAKFKAEFPESAKKFRSLMSAWAKKYQETPAGTKPVVTNECCWGSMDDQVRAQIVEESLKTFVELGIGFLPHALQESLAEDLHRPEFGEVGAPGFMAFVLMDGTLRPGHHVFNKYAGMALRSGQNSSKTPPQPPGAANQANPTPDASAPHMEKPNVDSEYF